MAKINVLEKIEEKISRKIHGYANKIVKNDIEIQFKAYQNAMDILFNALFSDFENMTFSVLNSALPNKKADKIRVTLDELKKTNLYSGVDARTKRKVNKFLNGANGRYRDILNLYVDVRGQILENEYYNIMSLWKSEAYDEAHEENSQMLASDEIDDARKEMLLNTPWAPDGLTLEQRIEKNIRILRNKTTKIVEQEAAKEQKPSLLAFALALLISQNIRSMDGLVISETTNAITVGIIGAGMDNKKEREGFLYLTAEDEKVCAECSAMNRKIIYLDDDSYFATIPPLHNRCRCMLVPLDLVDAEELEGVA